jgi:leader peptidase (prepilin peptidase) / N-methyltransferase
VSEATLLGLFVFLFGLIIGSFLNVCIHRWPRDESIVWPGSRCPGCSHAIAAYDNIPVLSYLMLGGRCRHCLRAISWRYPAAELLTAILFAAAWAGWGPTLGFVKVAVFSALCVGMIFADLETRLLPDEFTIGGAGIGLVFALLAPRRDTLMGLLLPGGSNARLATVAEAVVSAVLVAGLLWGMGEIFYRVRKVEYLGLGDVKMVAMMMVFLGLSAGIIAVFIGSALGAVVGGAYIYWKGKKGKEYHLPFGTFLGIGALWAAFVYR